MKGSSTIKTKYERPAEAILRDISNKLTKEEMRFIFDLARRRIRTRPFRFRFKDIQIAGTSKRYKTLIGMEGPVRMTAHTFRPNPDRVNLGRLNDLSFYCYPRIWPDKVFAAIGTQSIIIEDLRDSKKLLSLAYRAYFAVKSGLNTARIAKTLKERSTLKGQNKARKRVES